MSPEYHDTMMGKNQSKEDVDPEGKVRNYIVAAGYNPDDFSVKDYLDIIDDMRDFPDSTDHMDFTDSASKIASNLLEDNDPEEIAQLAASCLRLSTIDVKFDKAGWKEVEIPATVVAQFRSSEDYLGFLIDYLNNTYQLQFGGVNELGSFDHLFSEGKHPLKVYARCDAIRPL